MLTYTLAPPPPQQYQRLLQLRSVSDYKYEEFARYLLSSIKQQKPEVYAKLKPRVTAFNQTTAPPTEPNPNSTFYMSLVTLLGDNIPDKYWSPIVDAYRNRKAENAWRSLGFLCDPVEDIEAPLNVSANEHKKLWKGDIPKHVSLHREQVSTVTHKEARTRRRKKEAAQERSPHEPLNTRYERPKTRYELAAQTRALLCSHL